MASLAVGVAVVAPGDVAALVSGNDTVAVITAPERARNLRQWRPTSLACCTSRSSTFTSVRSKRAVRTRRRHLAALMAAVRGAETAGAARVPQAALHLKLAEEQIANAKQLMQNGDNGRADAMTIRAYNDAELALALTREAQVRRAEAVRAYLVSRGVAVERVRAQGLGLSRPVSDNKSAEGRANNRRVEIVVQPGANPT